MVEGNQARGPRRLQDGEREGWAEGGTAPGSWPTTSIFRMGRRRTDTGEELLRVTSARVTQPGQSPSAWQLEESD